MPPWKHLYGGSINSGIVLNPAWNETKGKAQALLFYLLHCSALLLLHGFNNTVGTFIGSCIVERYNGPCGCRYPTEDSDLQNQTENAGKDFSPQKKRKPGEKNSDECHEKVFDKVNQSLYRKALLITQFLLYVFFKPCFAQLRSNGIVLHHFNEKGKLIVSVFVDEPDDR